MFSKLFLTNIGYNCLLAHLNVDNLRDALFASNVLDRHKLKSAKALDTWIMGQNDMLATEFSGDSPPPGVSVKAWEKATHYDFYLGLTSNWYYN